MRARTPDHIREEIVQKIFLRRSLQSKVLAREYRLSVSTISKIWKEHWRNVPKV